MTKRTTLEVMSAIADDVLRTVEHDQAVKTAEVAAVRDATPALEASVGLLMHKLAADLRTSDVDVTYDDIHAITRGRS